MPSPQAIWYERLYEWIQYVLLLALMALPIASYWGWRMWEVRDAASGPVQTASAVVTGKRVADSRGRAGGGWNITLQLNGQPVVANTYNLPLVSRLAEGETVAVAYRIGKSGKVYVVDIAEMTKQRATTNPAAR